LTEIINCGPPQHRAAAKKRRGTLPGSPVDSPEESFEGMWRRLGGTARPEVRARVRLQYIENCNSTKDLTKIIECGQDIPPQLLTAAKKRRGTLSGSSVDFSEEFFEKMSKFVTVSSPEVRARGSVE